VRPECSEWIEMCGRGAVLDKSHQCGHIKVSLERVKQPEVVVVCVCVCLAAHQC